MRDDLENVYMLLFWFFGNGFQLALCSVSWLSPGVRRSRADPIVFAPWSVLLSDDDGGPRETRFMALTTQSFPIVSTCGFTLLVDVKITVPLTTRPDRGGW